MSDRLKGQIITILEDIQLDGLEQVAEPLYRQLQDRYKVRIEDYRLQLMQRDDTVIVLDIRRRDPNTYLNLP